MPTDLEAAIMLHREGRLAEAETAYRVVLASDPRSINALYLLGLLTETTRRLDEAMALFRQAAELAPQFPEPALHLGDCLRACGLLDDAEAAYRKALAAGDGDGARAGLDAIAAIRQGFAATRATMDWHYSSNLWSHLDGMAEAARYGIVAGYMRAAGVTGAVLDVGCGEGVLYDHLPPGLATAYVGVDISPLALEKHRATARAGVPASLFCLPLEEFTPPDGLYFGAAVFNEVLYFVADPLAALRRFIPRLAPGGILIISWHCMPQPEQVRKAEMFWRDAAQDFAVLDMALLTNLSTGLNWRVAALRPHGGSGPTR